MSQYNTKQGETLLRFLKENSSRHFTAAEIETQLAITGEKLGKATVYRRLDRLVEEGLVRRFVAVGVAACLVITGVSVLYGKGFFSTPENLISDESIQNQTVHNTAGDYTELLSFIKDYAEEYKEKNRNYLYY